MKGALKGAIFSYLLIITAAATSALINMKLNIPHAYIKGVMWVISAICVFAGALLVTKSAGDRKFIRGIICAVFTILITFITIILAGHGLPKTGSFFAYGLMCLLSGFLGALTGINN